MDGPGRSLTVGERAVLLTMLAADFPGSAELRSQVAGALVTGGCVCGCASIDLRVPDGPRASAAPVVTGALLTADIAGTSDGVLLFLRDGYLSHLEFYTPDDAPARLPRPEDLIVRPPEPGR
ncbi:hypothetical protein Misp01_45600 [Microtetraspora sp. NBRC 13810]|uniref:hypothetical protein n=1 Tax=Microtetraspora sp. NBRC 13810 TaxID=3030990 RepID=UPI0024A017D2|nr:hypothetical protein [Microtetraspora sp. NBRC 13810]GLW09431.1 hypothetical protein Misp01_45600 [Microtetraspora sp. NBRC 13810]